MGKRAVRALQQRRVSVEALESRLLLAAGPRQTEYLGRGVVATRSASNKVFVSWRSMASDPGGMAFNVYRSTNSGAATKLNSSPLTGGTNYTDNTTSTVLGQPNSYFVRPVVGGVEQPASATYTLAANSPTQPLFSIPLRDIGDYYVHHSWVGDLDGDGEYDFVVDRLPNQPGMTQRVEAYRRDGTFLWSVDCGPNSLDQDNIEPGSSAISTGNWDGVTVYDLDMDGKAEVVYRSANGAVFGDGATLSHANNNVQFMSVLNGMTGAERARVQIPTDYISDGPMAASLGVGYFDGVHPSLVGKMKNRVGNGSFNLMVVAWDFDGTSITQKWKWNRGTTDAPDGHQFRVVDVDQDGDDEYAEIGYVLEGDGSLKYSLAPQGVIHGDRFHIGDLDPDRPGLEGYGVQQDHPSFLYEYYYDAGTGQLLHQHFGTSVADIGRGIAADVDPNYRGYEYWSFSGIFNSRTPVAGQPPVETQLTTEPNRPWPNFRIWWDGDVLSENLNTEVIDKWNPSTQTTSRVSTLYTHGANATWRDAPTFYGDVIGDWREEVIFEKSDHTALQIYTTQISSSTRFYTLAQNPEYRNSLTVKGYLQSHMVDYYLGDGMAPPPMPDIAMHAPTTVISPPPAPTGLSAAIGARGVQVNLNWAAAAGAASYNVRRGLTDGGPWVVIGNTTATNFIDSTIAPNGGTYYYVVTQLSGSGVESTPSNQVHVTIGQPGTSFTYQAEDGTVSGGTVIANNESGYAGTGFADFPGNGGVLEWTNIDGGGGGVATLTFRYALASGSRTGSLIINGVAQSITFTSTGAWNNWETIAITASLAPGAANTIRLQSTGQNLANVDQVKVDVAAPPFMYNGGAAAETYHVRRNGADIDVWVNGDGSGLPTYRLIYSMTPSLTFTTGGDDDSVTVDMSGGNAMPAQGILFDGGAATDTLAIVGSAAADMFAFNATSIVAGGTLTQTAIERRTLRGNGGIDNLAINAGSVLLDAPLMVNNLSIASGAALDVRNFPLVIDYGASSPIGSWSGSAYTGITGLIQSGRGDGSWNGAGLVTSMSDATTGLTTLAAREASDVLGLSESQTDLWSGFTVDASAVLLKYTWGGDADLNGQLDGDDYFFIDSNVINSGSVFGFENGDFDYNGVIDGDDYFVIDANILFAQSSPPL